MSGPVTYTHDEHIAVIRMDDGKVNALGPTMQQALNEAIDNADRDNVKALVITGNQRVFSGGFDLKILTSGGELQPAIDMLRGGFELAYRLLSYPKPVVMACTGPAIAMGAFLLASGDHRIAAHAYNIQANEVAIGLTIPYAALEILKLRLTPSAYQQAAGLSKTFFGETALAAGFVDEIALPEVVVSRAEEAAREFAGLNQRAHAATKLRARADALKGIRAGIDSIEKEFGL
ncbi:enoyl-CoA hydratase [Mycobacterium intermedium]|uniref:Enoyl-CoA hydratase n=1 Tax=Mycobacterium intermedium TaxID=28445 RepID=A0A1E3S7R7_MYCIE|nr:crotonase/enoyl-CoA hydratase family protein [Mycobacterium intermedium]MCV6966122.1 crotonase/enoyl-CoA hydratase family protein [Mycobacterium intermedium]ODQ98203.1 enoyl-CoA hydratase [Mycobacterium intermedium]OPE50162.1 enoyl-CoA hydratase [Mycobacterium intermedium]ORA95428.1 enoyl-CoA hydratase [Mycobacterium intermedium]